MKGIITDIHRSSVVDGPGLRTTVFIKGCPLRCLWCHNPETQRHSIEPAFDWQKASNEDFERLGFNATNRTASAVLERIAEIGIKTSVRQCTSGAISAYGREVTVDEIVAEVLKDRDYYANSGGGVTLSGGEPMSQPAFTLEVLRRCRELGIHTVLDTTGFLPQRYIKPTLDVTDLYLFDYKATGEAKHLELTGVALTPVLETLDCLAKHGADILLRCPMIPGVNDTPEHLQAIADLQHKYPESIKAIDILTWHTMGQVKYTRLGRTPPAMPKQNVSEEKKAEYRAFFDAAGTTGLTVK